MCAWAKISFVPRSFKRRRKGLVHIACIVPEKINLHSPFFIHRNAAYVNKIHKQLLWQWDWSLCRPQRKQCTQCVPGPFSPFSNWRALGTRLEQKVVGLQIQLIDTVFARLVGLTILIPPHYSNPWNELGHHLYKSRHYYIIDKLIPILQNHLKCIIFSEPCNSTIIVLIIFISYRNNTVCWCKPVWHWDDNIIILLTTILISCTSR